jgi:asparagine synthase (glutamine-hydrolysing)
MKRSFVNISNLLTLRYDPTGSIPGTKNLRTINVEEISELRKNSGSFIPSSKDIEDAIRRIIRVKIDQSQINHVSISLSAGVDSNVIFSLIRSEFPNIDIDCLTVTFDDSNEALDAKRIAEGQGAGFHQIHVQNPLKDLPMLLSIIKEPRWNIYQYYFIEKAKSLSNLLFTGDGGDELFAGYSFRYKKFFENIGTHSSWLKKVQMYLLCHERDWVPDQMDMFGKRIKFSWSSVYNILKRFFDNDLDPLEQVLCADYHGKLIYDFAPTNEKYFKFFDIDGVAPLLDSKIVDMSVRIPASLKYDFAKNIGKLPLREIISRNITSYHIETRKVGYGMDLIQLWTKVGRDIVTSNLERARIFEDKIINREWYLKAMNRIDQTPDPRYISKMLQLLSLEVWYKLFITSEINPQSYI